MNFALIALCLFVQREKRLGLRGDQSSEDGRSPSRVSSLKRKPSGSQAQRVVSSRDLVRRVSSGRRDWTTKSKPTLTLASSPPLHSDSTFRSSRRSETDHDSSCSASSPTSPTVTSNTRRIVQADLTTSPSFKSKSPQTPPPSSTSIEDHDLTSSPSVKPWTRRSFQFYETSSPPMELPVKSISKEDTHTSSPSSPEIVSFSNSTSLSKEVPLVDLSSWSSPTVKPWTRGTFQSEEIPSLLVDFSVESVSEENPQMSLSSSKPPLPPKPSLPPREIPNEDLDPILIQDPRPSLNLKPQSRITFDSDDNPGSLELSIKSTDKEARQTSPPSSPELFSSAKATSTSMLLSRVADDVDGRPRSKPPLAPKPKFISSEVTPSHHPKKTSPPSYPPPVTRRFPAPTEPPPPPPEERSPPESSPPAVSEDLLDLDGSGSSPFDVIQPDSSVKQDHSASAHPAPSSPQLGSSDVRQKEETSGLSSSKQEVETKLKEE